MLNKPKDIGLKIGTKTEVLWEEVKRNSEEQIPKLEIEIEIHRAHIDLAKIRIKEEHAR